VNSIIVSSSSHTLGHVKKGTVLPLAAVTLLSAGCMGRREPAAPFGTSPFTRVDSVVDGDTLRAFIREREERIRLIGVDAPETAHPGREGECFGEASATFTKRKLEGRRIRLEFDVQHRDRFGRLLAYVILGDALFNEVLIAQGFATAEAYPPNLRHQSRLILAEAEARLRQRGLWRACERKYRLE
jgi:micrococcal nuclease